MMASDGKAHAIVVFDGVCAFCNGSIGFLLRHDNRQRYHFAAMQSEPGRRLLLDNGLNPDDPASFLLVEYDQAGVPRISSDSEAALRVLTGLGGVWRLAGVLRVVPRGLRDGMYRWFARNRYRWFGRHDSCTIPAPEVRHRFL
ncbi:MAG: thiol-disulfide oxidoreductase DCC family protein [Pseudomonadales bacterium]|uniref:thiol-disulfide oxidoreductase DCC family protein n=1 Tax=Thermomonas sp. TaxID=1971895 RepID=UPI002608A886|nr:thiol-disulfide oxidoreductase DCC family protein [Thermomonas sp.]MCC6296225.1 thiol-disulfide oxidoreductase DCC family protein [Pseudomonadales bacterium]MCO5055278.1 thiol-disulfide oxidoreductase DCC family protein [Thermomonas sp.]